ncbi:MAG: response regulator [Chloroflexi bacterium]|nr:response regulator [Chloroflexota bacterium]
MTAHAYDIILVEDNPADVELALRALRKNSITNEVLVLRDGEEALDYFFIRGRHQKRTVHPPPRLILLDLNLPKVSGLEVLQAISRDKVLSLIPVVVLTSSREEVDLIRSYRLGVNSYILKPVDFDQFMEVVRELGLYWLVLNQMPETEI